MDLYPAIDVRAGRCVRLTQGDYGRETVYGDDPVEVARAFARAGAPWIHVVDLDAARTGRLVNRDVVAAVVAAVDVPVQSGGGVRDAAAAEALLGIGVSRVVVGTAAVTEPALVEMLAERHPGKVAVGLDHRGAGGRREVAVRGWTEGSGRDLVELAGDLAARGAAALVVTDIDRDGMLEGPDLEAVAAVLATTTVDVIASGGVGSVADLARLAAVEAGGRRLAGAIVGKAIYEGRLNVAEAVAACAR